jgi:hypothetical protein
MEKSIGAKIISDRKLDEVFDRIQRQMGQMMPLLVSTHQSYNRSY